jgi:hypothetical protein
MQIGIPGTSGATTDVMGDINFYSRNGTGAVVSRSLIRSGLDGATNSNSFTFFTMNAGTLAERFKIASTGAATFNTTATTAITMQSSASASGLRLKNNGGTASDWIIQSDGGVAATAAFRIYSVTADAYRMAILGNGNLGIGATTAPSRLSVYWDRSTAFAGSGIYDTQVYNASNHGGTITFGGTYNSGGSITEWSGIGGNKENTTDGDFSGTLVFYTRPNGSGMTERVRITSDGNQINYGNIFLNQTSVATINANATSIGINGIYYMNRGSGSGLSHVILGNGGNVIGGISSNTTNAQFNTSSDYRLKEDLKDFNALNILLNIKLYDFAWKLNNSRMYGVMAHELKEVLPYAVVGEKDEIDEDGNIKSQGVDYSLLTPILAKAIQELEARIKQLENK